ncbi:MAG: hypothetical protein AABZ30_05155, partial [Myxococcota bacterium]
FYTVKNPWKALVRDLGYLIGLGAISATRPAAGADHVIGVNLKWPTEITETEFFRRVKVMPKGKVHGFLSS